MITKERLEELIKQGGTVWGYNDESVFDLPLKNTNNRMVAIPASSLIVDWYAGKGKGWFTAYYDPNKLCETKEQAEWALKTSAERTERFEPPMWEDTDEHYTFDWMSEGYHYRFAVDKPHNCIVILEIDIRKDIFDEPATKENYIKACEMVRDLFKGEK